MSFGKKLYYWINKQCFEKVINVLKNENGINLEEYDEYKNLLEQKEKTEKIIADKDLFNSIYSNKVNA